MSSEYIKKEVHEGQLYSLIEGQLYYEGPLLAIIKRWEKSGQNLEELRKFKKRWGIK
jgi:hypothetical protein